MFNFFGWLRRRTAEAVIAGLGDAAGLLDDGHLKSDSKAIEFLNNKLAAQVELQTLEPEKKR